MRMFASGVRCGECALFCRLHYMKAKERLDIQNLLAGEVRPLAFVCRMCGAVTRHSQHEVCEVTVDDLRARHHTAPSMIYRLQFHCSDPACRVPLDLYAEVSVDENFGAVLDWLFSLDLVMRCSAGHLPTALNPSTFRMPSMIAEVCPNQNSWIQVVSA
jgi:hypothetical protein